MLASDKLTYGDFIGYIVDHLEYDSESNTSLDMDELEYSSLYQRLLKVATAEPTKDHILTLMVIATIMFILGFCSKDKKEFQLASMFVDMYYVSADDKTYTSEDVTKDLCNHYNFLVNNCTFTKFSVVTHSYKTLVSGKE